MTTGAPSSAAPTLREPPSSEPASSEPAARGGQSAPGVAVAVPLTFVLVVMAWLTWRAARPLDNHDTWFHLRIGRELLGPWTLQETGRLSSFGDVAWVPTQWSSEMVAAAVEQRLGLPGVAWLVGAVLLGLAAAVYVTCRREGDPLPAAVATGAAVLATSAGLSARPQLVTLVLLVVVAASWLGAERHGRVPFHLVPLTWLWATAHGMWSVGVVVSAICCAGLLLDRRQAGRSDRRSLVRFASVPLLSLAAACLTPLGPSLVVSQLVVGRRVSMIGEWGPTSFREAPALVLAAMAATVIVCWARGGHVSWLRVLLLLTAVGGAVLAVRMVPCGAVLVAPLLAAAVQQHLPRRTTRVHRSEVAVVTVAGVVLLTVLALVVPHTADRPAGVPTAFGSQLAALPAGSAVAVQDGTGAWMEWRYPQLDPVIDGMLDAYPVGHIERFDDFVAVRPGWQEFLRDSGARVAVLVDGSALCDAVQRLGWSVTARSGRWVLLAAPEPAVPGSGSG